jgi:DNA-binding CsgD family transcriptional regulator
VSGMQRRLQGKDLSQPEVEVLRAAAEGLSAKETAAQLLKSKHTIITQRRSLQAKLGARNLLHAVAIGVRLRLVDTDLGTVAPSRNGAGNRRRGAA